MKNYWAVGCKDYITTLKEEVDELFMKVEEDANQENINAYREKLQEYLRVKKELENIEEKLPDEE